MTTLSLDSLRDIHLPPEPMLVILLSPWSITTVLTALLVAIVWLVRRRLRQKPLRAVMRELKHLSITHRHDGDGTALARGLSQLLRRYAAQRFGQTGIAGLTGRDWLEFLDAHGGGGGFCNGVGAVLETRPYQLTGDFDAAALISLVRQWVQENRP
jgi:hypothetical protein